MAASTGLLTQSCSTDTEGKKALSAKNVGNQLPGVEDWEHERNQSLHAEQFFTEHEMTTITLLADIIIPKDEKSGSASEAGVPDFIEFIVKDIPLYKTPMRGGLKWMDVQSQKRYGKLFKDSEEIEQIALVDEVAYPELARPEMQQGVFFFALMRNLTASGFFTSEMGVRDIGYVGNTPGVWKGVPSDVLAEHGFDTEGFFG